MKEKIEQLYIDAVYNDIAPNVFADEVMQILNLVCEYCERGNKATCCDKCVDEMNDRD